MANIQNLRPFTSDQSREEAAKNGKQGGIKSGEVRRQKQQLRQIAQTIIDGEYNFDGEKLSGSELIAKKLVEIINDTTHKHWFDVIKILIQLTDSDKNESQLELSEMVNNDAIKNLQSDSKWNTMFSL